jgi:hypothetical protein
MGIVPGRSTRSLDVMVVLALTRAGYEELLRHTKEVPPKLWLGHGVLTNDEIERLRLSGVDVTPFNHAIDPTDSASVEGAVHTVAQHHPGETIWVERKDDVVEGKA